MAGELVTIWISRTFRACLISSDNILLLGICVHHRYPASSKGGLNALDCVYNIAFDGVYSR